MSDTRAELEEHYSDEAIAQADMLAALVMEGFIPEENLLTIQYVIGDELAGLTKSFIEDGIPEEDDRPECPHGCGTMVNPTHGDPLEPDDPYCPDCGHIEGHGCGDGCHYEEDDDE